VGNVALFATATCRPLAERRRVKPPHMKSLKQQSVQRIHRQRLNLSEIKLPVFCIRIVNSL
jgi:hypothetical protein